MSSAEAPRVSLATLLDYAFLKRWAWKPILERHRETRITNSPLVRDPLDYLAFEHELKGELDAIVQLASGRQWVPRSATILRGAKKRGISRPLSHLEVEEAVLLSALSLGVASGFHRNLPPWVNFGRTGPLIDIANGTNRRRRSPMAQVVADASTAESGTWFVKWLQYMGLLGVMSDNSDAYVVQSDITNFFPSIHRDLLRDMLFIRSSVETEAIDLLMNILAAGGKKHRHLPDSRLGLPQENNDSSRRLAHGFLLHLDQEFSVEGQAGRYTRWMDDIAVSVPTVEVGYEVLSRIQAALDYLNLTPHSTKSRVITKLEFEQEHLVSENEFIDEVERQFSAGLAIDTDAISLHIAKFRTEDHGSHKDRIMRRFYTLSSNIGLDCQRSIVHEDLAEFPHISQHIFDYLSRTTFSLEVFKMAERVVSSLSRFYDDVPVHWYECLLICPIPDSDDVREWVTRSALNHLRGEDGYGNPSGYVSGLIALVVHKFGSVDQLRSLVPFIKASEDPRFLRQAYICLRASPPLRDEASEVVRYSADPDVVRIRRFLDQLEAGDSKCWGAVQRYSLPSKWKSPERRVIRPRALPCLQIAARVPGRAATIRKHVDAVRASCQTASPVGNDSVLLRLLAELRP